MKITGKITINRYRAGMVDHVAPLLETLQELKVYKNNKTGKYAGWIVHENLIDYFIQNLKEELERIKASYFIETAVECPNLIMDSPGYGLDLLIQRLTGNNTYSGNILWMEIGTGVTTPTVNDTALTTPVARAAVSYQEDYGATDAIVQAYIIDANLANQTYNEVGSFVDGIASIGSGRIFNHALLSPAYAKTAGTDTTIQVDVNIVNS